MLVMKKKLQLNIIMTYLILHAYHRNDAVRGMDIALTQMQDIIMDALPGSDSRLPSRGHEVRREYVPRYDEYQQRPYHGQGHDFEERSSNRYVPYPYGYDQRAKLQRVMSSPVDGFSNHQMDILEGMHEKQMNRF